MPAMAVVQVGMECTTNADGQKVCTPTSSPSPVITGGPGQVVGFLRWRPTPTSSAILYRFVWDSYNRQTASWTPSVADRGGAGTEGPALTAISERRRWFRHLMRKVSMVHL
jgi:hypothetical protein